jgi:hemolysin activation/secretion protein
MPRAAASCLLGLLLGAVSANLADAQDFDRIAPREPPAAPPPVVTPPPAATPSVPASTAMVVPDLKGLVFLPSLTALQPNGRGDATGLDTGGLPLLSAPDFAAQLKSFLGRPLTFADLAEITRLTTAFYRVHGRPFVSVDVPPQNVSAGVVQVVVTEYRLGAVTVAGNEWFSSDLIRRQSGLVPGQTLTLSGVRTDLDRLNDNPFRSVETVFQPGAAPGTTDVTLQTKDRLPVHLYASFDNAGVRSLGLGEWGVGGSWGNVFGTGQTLSYQHTRSLSGRYDANSVSLTVPLPWRDKLLVFGSYAQETPDIGKQFGETGQSGQASLRYVHPLPHLTLATDVELTGDLQAGYDFKTSNNNLEFGGVQVSATAAEIDQFPLIADATITDKLGQTALENQLVLSPGGLTGANTKAAFQALVAGSRPGYAYDRVGVTRTTFLPKGFSWTARVLGQVSSGNLQSSEQLGAGGPDSVRGYYTDASLGSQGVLVSQEIRAPAFSLAGMLHSAAPVADQVQFGVFWDYGHVSQNTPIPKAVNQSDLSSVGVVLHGTLDRFVDVKFDTGWRLREAPGTNRHGAFGDVALVVGF